jgi:hypothetical protein
MKFDLPQIDTKSLADTGVLMTVKQFDGDEPLIAKNGEPVRIRLRGPDSDVYREFSRKQIQKRFARGNDRSGSTTSIWKRLRRTRWICSRQ